MPRPKKYPGEMTQISIYMPLELFRTIEEISKTTGVSRNQVLVTMLMSADRELANEILAYYKDVQETLKKTGELIDPATVFVKVKEITLPKEISEDPAYKDAIRRAKTMLKKGQLMSEVIRWLIPEIENVALAHGYAIKQKHILAAHIIAKLSEEGKAKT